ncbi:M23 family metallopeptidase [Natronoglycomyces albus]|uniref:M23 family metallopeptidase n=1 Tax=Natronoglycomyces albus TaxID=2811108 RepID=A0A895XWF8_9ACTN|nr:M23 family metallopeptidase [Natronoglycomyces albus]QSB06856.1 M23 family metallopeptidase [Natronoglycomyces albus]
MKTRTEPMPTKDHPPKRVRIAKPLIATAVLVSTTFSAPYAKAEDNSGPDLTEAVTAQMHRQHGNDAAESYGLGGAAQLPAPLVEPYRVSADGQWTFGGSVYLLPEWVHATPVTALFVAREVAGEWEVALQSGGEFAQLMEEAPVDLFPDAREKSALTSSNLRGLARPGLALPWAEDQGGWRHWGVHGNGGNTRPFNAIDFYGGDGKTRASADGFLYRFCGTVNPYIEIHHVNGWRTGYYHLRNQTDVPSGSFVKRYDFLGEIGEELPCGGRANGDHVHWTLWHESEGQVVQDRVIGGWTWHEERAYRGWAQRGNERIGHSDCCLVNYGPFDGYIFNR